MKHFIVLLAILIAQWAGAQDMGKTDKQILEDVKISIEMGSVEDIETLDSEELISIFDYAKADQPIELKIICNFDYKMEDLTISGTTLTLNGNTSEMDEFSNKAQQIQSTLKKLYKTEE